MEREDSTLEQRKMEYEHWIEISDEQMRTDTICNRFVMRQLMKEMLQDYRTDLHWESTAIGALQTAAENYLIEMFQKANAAANHAHRPM
jgi:histone H3